MNPFCEVRRLMPSVRVKENEYFVDEQNKRLVAFGYYAGFIGAGLGLLQYLKKTNGNKLSNLKYITIK